MIHVNCEQSLTDRYFFFQAEDGIRDDLVTGVQTCALPILPHRDQSSAQSLALVEATTTRRHGFAGRQLRPEQIGRASCRERVYISVVDGARKRNTERVNRYGSVRMNETC